MDLQGGSHTISQVDGVSSMAPAYWVCWRRAQQRDNGLYSPQCQTLSLSLHATGALQAASLVLELRGSESE